MIIINLNSSLEIFNSTDMIIQQTETISKNNPSLIFIWMLIKEVITHLEQFLISIKMP